MDDVDLLPVFEAIEKLLPGTAAVSTKIGALIDLCESLAPHDDWATLRGLPYDEETGHLVAWLRDLWAQQPPSAAIRGLWFGLFNPLIDEDHASADVRLTGSPSFDGDGQGFEWAMEIDYDPAGGEARSSILASIYAIAYADESSLGNTAEYSLVFGYTAFAIAHILRSFDVPAALDGAGVAVGFDSGDGIVLGRLTPTGLVLAS